MIDQMQFSFRLPVRPKGEERLVGFLDFGDFTPATNMTTVWMDIDTSYDAWAVPIQNFTIGNISLDLGDARAVFSTAIPFTVMPCSNLHWLVNLSDVFSVIQTRILENRTFNWFYSEGYGTFTLQDVFGESNS